MLSNHWREATKNYVDLVNTFARTNIQAHSLNKRRSSYQLKLCYPVQRVNYVIEFICALSLVICAIIANQSLVCKFDMVSAHTSQICLRGAELSLVRLNADDMFRRPGMTLSPSLSSFLPFV